MRYPTILVCLKLGVSNHAILQVTRQLATRFHARVIGISAYRPIQVIATATAIAAEVIEADQSERSLEVKQAETEFRAQMQGVENLQYRAYSTLSFITEQISRDARCADLCIVEGGKYGVLQDGSRYLDLADLLVALGRPMFVVPRNVSRIDFSVAFVAWTDSKESRRAVQDALPLLSLYEKVIVGAIASAENLPDVQDSLDDVVAYLKEHGLVATTTTAAKAEDDAVELNHLAQSSAAGVIVAGAYGHSRLREWVLGGVTRSLLLHPQRCALLSH